MPLTGISMIYLCIAFGFLTSGVLYFLQLPVFGTALFNTTASSETSSSILFACKSQSRCCPNSPGVAVVKHVVGYPLQLQSLTTHRQQCRRQQQQQQQQQRDGSRCPTGLAKAHLPVRK